MAFCSLRFCLPSLILAALVGHTCLASPPPPLVPPQGWEREVTPGFEPAIEKVLADWEVSRPVETDIWQHWGSEAVPVLMKIYRDERWKDFRPAIQGLLFRSGLSEAIDALKQRLDELERLDGSAPGALYETTCITGAFVWQGSPELREHVFDRAVHAPEWLIPAYVSSIGARVDRVSYDSLTRLADEGGETMHRLATERMDWIDDFFRAEERVSLAPGAIAYGDGKGQKGVARKELKAMKRAIETGKHLPSSEPGRVESTGATLVRYAEAAGNKAIPLIEEVINRPAGSRETGLLCSAYLALGRIGSEKSVAAFTRLRDRSLTAAGIPKVEDGTHAEKMTEAAAIALGLPADYRKSLDEPNSWGRQWKVSNDYSESSMECASSFVQLKRFGDEWIPVAFEPLPVY